MRQARAGNQEMAAAPRRPGRPRRDASSVDTAERILDVATDLFAARGYDGVSIRDIAAAVGVNVATVHHHGGGKAQLYDAVFARIFAAEAQALEAVAARVRERLEESPQDVLAGLHEILDAFLDFVEEHPEVTFLWLRRWLEPDRHGELDERYSLPLYELIADLLSAAERDDLLTEPHPRHAIRTIVWSVHGHVTAVAATGRKADPVRAEFRAFAHRLIDRLYGGAG